MKSVSVGLVLVVLGGGIVALPDRNDPNDRLFSFSKEHGPAPLDALGVVILLAGYLLPASLVWRRRRRLSRGVVLAAVVAFLAGGAVLVPAVAYDLGALWGVAVAVMVLPQAYMLLQALIDV